MGVGHHPERDGGCRDGREHGRIDRVHAVPYPVDDPDPAGEGMNLVPNVAQERPIRALMNNSFGFGGTNCALVFKAP